jgi:hypothetical protein
MQIPAPLSRVLDSRGITGAARDTFLSPAIWSQMEAPESLPGMIAVRDRILTAVRRSQPISIFGDYVAPAFM